MTDGKKPRATQLVKTIRVSEQLHERFRAFQFDGHYRSADVAMEALLAESVVRIPVPPDVLTRWTAEAAESGFPLDAWAAQRIESGTIKCVFHAVEVRQALAELDEIKRALLAGTAPAAPAEPAEAPPFRPCKSCTTPKSCEIGGQDPRECE